MIKENDAMTAPKSVYPADCLREQAETASPDLLRAMVKTFADALMSAEADAICGAPYGQRSEERTNSRNVICVSSAGTSAASCTPPTAPRA